MIHGGIRGLLFFEGTITIESSDTLARYLGIDYQLAHVATSPTDRKHPGRNPAGESSHETAFETFANDRMLAE
jgi:hypothetical protein